MDSARPPAAADADTVRAFKRAVNMTPRQLGDWLETDDSRAVGFKGAKGREGGESVGHRSGRRIVRLLAKARGELTAGDIAHMRKVVGYVKRHLAQRPEGDITETPWRYSLMNWGHDPKHAPGKRAA
ncbi:DUF3140 domain-containing protein [Variovorax sp. IB41]|uniref:DUF3140 domain-containing protein n=1 Tax=Variovorax sp. IB41 TaxID=2779370 RepID=UPI0018E8A8F2|nr:DUF3140 domain-containing protein [Variovorax sp. IB41]MBJ2155129.1 DUF3140 domain-containing protein [Variovorax sp. IB41]